MIDVEAVAGNSMAMWSGTATEVSLDHAVFRADTPRTTRLILRRPATADVISDLLESVPATRATVLEDVFGAGRAEPADPAVRVHDMPIMVRPAGPPPAAGKPVRIVRVTDAGGLGVAERTVVEGFPVPAFLPWREGEALPERVLSVPGCSVWLAYREDQPAGAACTLDDGEAVGVYWVATSPEHRSAGIGRAVMTHVVGAHPDRPAVLTATRAGRPLYESMGFRAIATTTWYMRPAR
ncbi:GNAT family N-acetyltransferase [Actinoplanes sp. CA-054009]